MDAKLKEYRTRKQREEFITTSKNALADFGHRLYDGIFARTSNKHQNNSNIEDDTEPMLLKKSSDRKHSDSEDDEVIEHRVPSDAEIDTLNCCSTTIVIKYLLIFIIWATGFYIFILWEFGMVYFGISALVMMYLNTRTGRKLKGEISAYSVFNKNCQSIHGTVKAEDLERQMIFGQL